MTDHPLSTFTIRYSVSGPLDGVTPAPNLVLGPVAATPPATFPTDISGMQRQQQQLRTPIDDLQIYEPPIPQAQALGLIDPDFTGETGSMGDRMVNWVSLVSNVPGDADARLAVVDASGVITSMPIIVLEPVADLAGQRMFYTRQCFTVPQGSVIQIQGFPAGDHVILINLTGPTNSARDEAWLAAGCCCQQTGDAPVPCDTPEILAVDPAEVPTSGTPQTITITGSGFLATDIVEITGPAPSPTNVVEAGSQVFVNGSTLTVDATFATGGSYTVFVRRVGDPEGCFARETAITAIAPG